MAQTMLLMSGVSTGRIGNLKKDPLLAFQTQRLKPKQFSHLLFNPSVAASSKLFTAFALFKSKTKAPPKKVTVLLIFLLVFVVNSVV